LLPGQETSQGNKKVTQINVTQEGRYLSTTHYVACSAQDGRLVPCYHLHETIAKAAACVEGADGSVKAFTDGQERPLTCDELNNLVTELSALLHEQKELARRDDLTPALNRRAFEQVLFKEVVGYQSRLSRRKGHPLSFAYIDLDGFKALNDDRGHPVSDLVLKAVVQTMQNAVRASDSVARLGGDEFALLLPDPGAEGARILMMKLEEALSAAMRTHAEHHVQRRLGDIQNSSSNPERVIDVAERQMRFAKSQGKNRISYLTTD
jgi:diguanylate cyclase (GGDEF)-like protein